MWRVKVKSLSHVWLFATPWTAACQVPPYMRFSRQEYWRGLPLPSPTSMWNECNCAVVWTFFGIAFLWYWNENWPFPVLWKFGKHIGCGTFTASSFRIWNSSTGILSPPLALFTVMLLKARLTSHFKMSGSKWLSNHHDYLGREDLFCTVFLCILTAKFHEP